VYLYLREKINHGGLHVAHDQLSDGHVVFYVADAPLPSTKGSGDVLLMN
jgi:hypothetical protein